MNTIELMKAMGSNKTTKKNFKGVFPADKLPRKVKRPAMIISNTDESTKPGQHWIAFYFPTKGKIEYFDSIGQLPVSIHHLKFLQKHGKNFLFNEKRLQGYFSSVCGNYCAMFLLNRTKKKSYKNFIKQFSNNLDKNDEEVMKMYKSSFKSTQFGANSTMCIQSCQPCP